MPSIATILIVDDTAAGRYTLEELLYSPDYHLSFAGNGLEALVKAAELVPDLILLDVMMPGMDGFEVCRRLRANPHLAEIPVIMITALDDRASLLQGLEAGADDFISKPFDRAELRARVRTITRLNRYRRLLAERAQLVWVVEQSNDGYLLVSSQDEVLYANPKARLYLGFAGAPGEFITEKFRVQAQKQYRCEPVEAWADWPAQSNTSLQTSRYLVRPESATARACWLQVALLDRPAGLENYRLIQLRDVTAQMNLQRDVRTFHNMLSHKLRTPLTFITASLETMSEEQPPLSVEEMIDLSKMALKGAHRLREEIEDILRYLNISKLTQRDTRCLLSEIPQIVTKIRNDLRLPSVRVFGQVDVEDVQLILSRRAVESILWEILENAQKFHPLQSPLVGVTITPCLEESAVNLKIADDGLTLSPEQLSQAWLPYYQGEKYFTGQATGMGLGLPTVASLIWEAGGSCSLYNRAEGAGVVVELNIPLAQP